MNLDGNREYYEDRADDNLGKATRALDALRIIRNAPSAHGRVDIDREERAAKDAIGRAVDAIQVLQDVGD